MKRLFAILLVGLLLLSSASAAGVAATVTGGWLRLRDAPSYDSNTIASYFTGTKVTVLSTSGGWSYVQMSDGKTGYMNSSFLSYGSGSSTPSVPSGSSIYATAYVTSSNGGRVALRAGAGKSYAVITYCNVGTKITVLNAGSTWDRIQVGSTIGYMMAKYITFSPVSPGEGGGGIVPTTPTTAYVTSGNGKNVNLRSGPGKGYSVIASFPVGKQVTILSKGTTWHYIQVGSLKGYMMRQYLTATDPGGHDPFPITGTAYVTSANGKGVRLRSGPGTGYSVIGLYEVNTLVTILEGGPSWCRIQIGSQVGYMMTKFLTKKPGPSPEPPVVHYTAYVTSPNGKDVYLRYGPSTAEAAIALYPVGTEVTVLKTNGTWDYVMIGTRTGYMMHKYLTTSPVTNVITDVSISNSSPKVNDTLTANIVPGSATASYTWINDLGVVLSSESYYVAKASDIGRKIRVRVVGTGAYTGSATSNYTNAVSNSGGSNIVTGCTINNNSPRVNDILKASAVPSDATVSYIWYREGNISIGTGSTYTVTSADTGFALYAVAIGYNSWTGSATSSKTSPVLPVSDVALSGTVTLPPSAVVGNELTPSLSLNSYAITYQWYQNGVLVGTGSKLQITEDMAGDDIRLVVTAVSGSGYTGSVSSSYCLIQTSIHG
ncbi:MAG: SH3 domain-containing protein [Clostridiales bacterium]|nr:SH3 domain-containing protein [Clostridia bacterium]MCR4884695.1 SH3 domain-containing protein [Clostridiales bacterium]